MTDKFVGVKAGDTVLIANVFRAFRKDFTTFSAAVVSRTTKTQFQIEGSDSRWMISTGMEVGSNAATYGHRHGKAYPVGAVDQWLNDGKPLEATSPEEYQRQKEAVATLTAFRTACCKIDTSQCDPKLAAAVMNQPLVDELNAMTLRIREIFKLGKDTDVKQTDCMGD